MTLTARELHDVAAEIDRLAKEQPRRMIVQKIVQPDAATLLLGCSGAWLCLCADAELGRLHLVEERPPGSGIEAPAFCMLVRKELTGTRLTGCRAVAGERACELRFERGDAEGARLVRLFLFGRSGQLQLNRGDGSLLGSIGPARRSHDGLPAERPEGSSSGTSRFGTEPGLSARIAGHYREAATQSLGEAARKAAESELRARLTRQTRRLRALEGDRERALLAAGKRKLADLLLAHLGEVPRGASEVTLPDDFEAGEPITIPLDPARSPKANVERLYKEHTRLKRALASIDARLAETRRQVQESETELDRIAHADPAALAAFAAARPIAARPKQRAKQMRLPPYHELHAASGALILVGRGADRNDELTFQVARGSDLWLHARDVPGAHVIVPLRPGAAIDEQTLLDAATLAAHHSAARGEPQVDIGYTLRKHVRKPPKSRPGTVLTSELKTIRIRLEPARLARLLASKPPDPK